MTKITTIIFDLGGVILNLDQERTLSGFKQVGLDMEELDHIRQMLNDFEKGLITSADFRSAVRKELKEEITDEEIDRIWNSMLLDMPAERLALIKTLKKDFRVYLLSNTNVIHINDFTAYFEKQFKEENWEQLFHKVYYSYKIGMRKPDADIYRHVLDDIGAEGRECIFIDDNKANLEGAASCGINTIWASEPLSPSTIGEITAMADHLRTSAD